MNTYETRHKHIEYTEEERAMRELYALRGKLNKKAKMLKAKKEQTRKRKSR